MINNLILLGAGGHCKSIIEIIESNSTYTIKGILDPSFNNQEPQYVLGYPIIGNDDSIVDLIKQNYQFVITVGQIQTSSIRQKLFNKVKKHKGLLPVIIANTAYVSKHSTIAEGTVIMHYAIINAQTIIGKAAIINTRAIIEHECIIGDFNHISTGVILNGEVSTKNNVFIGSGSVVNQQVSIGNDVLIASGSLVRKNIISNVIAKGNPLKIIKSNE